jgi:membrane protease YdiL (CAAX protease family)
VTHPGSEPSIDALPARPAPASPWPAWPGWLISLVGLIVALTGLTGLVMIDMGDLQVRNPNVLRVAAVTGAGLLVFGLAYHSVRGIRGRRHLEGTRYRGPSVLVLLALAVALANIAAWPFAGDLLVVMESGGALGTVEALVLLTSTQLALLVVVGLFVTLPGALENVPPFDGGDALRSLRTGLGFGIVSWIVAMLVTLGVVQVLERLGQPITPQPVELALNAVDPVVIVVAAVVLAPLSEEIFFRGVAFTAWRREYGRRRAFIGSSVVFALIHLSLVSILPIFVLALGLAWVYERTRSLLASVTMHATFNGISVSLLLLERAGVFDVPF